MSHQTGRNGALPGASDHASFIRGAGALYSLYFATRLSSLISSVLLARLLSLDDYGAYIMAFAAVSILAIVTDFGTSDAILAFMPKHRRLGQEDRCRSLFAVAVWLRLSLAAAMAGLLWIISDIVARLILPHDPGFGLLLRIVSLTLVFDSVQVMLNSLLLVYKRFSVSFSLGVAASVLRLAAVPAGVILIGGAKGGLIGNLAAGGFMSLVSIVLLTLLFRGYVGALASMRGFLRQETWSHVRDLVRFGGFLTLNNLSWVVRDQGKNLTAGSVLGAGSTALFNRAAMLADLPADAGNALRGVTVPFFSEGALGGEDSLRRRHYYVTKMIILYASVITVLLVLFSREIIVLLYSEKFVVAATPLAILSSVTIFRIMGMPFVALLTSLGHTRTLAIVGALNTGLMLVLVTVGASLYGLVGLSLAVVGTYAMVVPVFSWLSYRRCGIAFDYRLLVVPAIALSLAKGINVAAILMGLPVSGFNVFGLVVFFLVMSKWYVTESEWGRLKSLRGPGLVSGFPVRVMLLVLRTGSLVRVRGPR